MNQALLISNVSWICIERKRNYHHILNTQRDRACRIQTMEIYKEIDNKIVYLQISQKVFDFKWFYLVEWLCVVMIYHNLTIRIQLNSPVFGRYLNDPIFQFFAFSQVWQMLLFSVVVTKGLSTASCRFS